MVSGKETRILSALCNLMNIILPVLFLMKMITVKKKKGNTMNGISYAK